MFWQPFVEALALLALRLVNTLRADWGAKLQWLVFLHTHTHRHTRACLRSHTFMCYKAEDHRMLNAAVSACWCFAPLTASQLSLTHIHTHWQWNHILPQQSCLSEPECKIFIPCLAWRIQNILCCRGGIRLFGVSVTLFVFNQQAHISCPTLAGQIFCQCFVNQAQVSGFRGPVYTLVHCCLLYWAVKSVSPWQAGSTESVTAINWDHWDLIHKCLY